MIDFTRTNVIETVGVEAHISSMSTVAAAKRSSPSKTSVYRGVTLPTATPGSTRFSPTQLKKAVETAVAKNAGALSGSN
jgi:hypothetical protein